MSKKATLKDLKARAKVAIDNNEPLVYDICCEYGQDLENVKHMTWFQQTVALQLCHEYKKYNHLAAEVRSLM